ncbi:MAG: tRNA lysidine(34) synthetase TilS [Verrucomicrobiota bacterium]|nr:tRNA lysidine(34) synthetase TilS [Verrucomicrobiota bacterium]MCC6821332.1 tRNA lysidine(34) synthetase TilS [Limisphaerales bacterium]
MKNLLEHVEDSVGVRKLFRRGERILVAVSGGLDSMVLLHLLHRRAPRGRGKLFVAHFNHQLRGRASDADECFVRRTAAALGLPFRVGRAAVKAFAQLRGFSVEMAARELRHKFLARTAVRLKCRVVALAHHADDQVELFFLRVFRGAGGEGLAGMKWRSPSPANRTLDLVRPLLDVSKAELVAFAHAQGIHFREDASNVSVDILRNRVRHELLPWLRRRFQPALDQSVRRLMTIVGGEAEVVDAVARSWLAKSRPVFDRLAVGVQRRVLQLQLQRLEVATDFELIEALRRAVNQPVTVGAAVTVVREKSGRISKLIAAKEQFQSGRLALRLKAKPQVVAFAGVEIGFCLAAQGGVGGRRMPAGAEIFDAAKVGAKIVLRHWQPGDRFQPIGMPVAMKLQDWFTNRKIPRARRRQLIVATTSGGEVFWVEDQRISERFKLTAATRRRLIWRWRRL